MNLVAVQVIHNISITLFVAKSLKSFIKIEIIMFKKNFCYFLEND